jgi:hypothetical protein
MKAVTPSASRAAISWITPFALRSAYLPDIASVRYEHASPIAETLSRPLDSSISAITSGYDGCCFTTSEPSTAACGRPSRKS